MGSVLRLVRDRKKSKRMGEVQIVDREAYSGLDPPRRARPHSSIGKSGFRIEPVDPTVDSATIRTCARSRPSQGCCS
jgi:hypothetical protein